MRFGARVVPSREGVGHPFAAASGAELHRDVDSELDPVVELVAQHGTEGIGQAFSRVPVEVDFDAPALAAGRCQDPCWSAARVRSTTPPMAIAQYSNVKRMPPIQVSAPGPISSTRFQYCKCGVMLTA